MGRVEGLHHLDAKALVRAEKHRVVDGASGSALLFGSHAGPRPPAPGGLISQKPLRRFSRIPLVSALEMQVVN
jgi:hypothetical protein